MMWIRAVLCCCVAGVLASRELVSLAEQKLATESSNVTRARLHNLCALNCVELQTWSDALRHANAGLELQPARDSLLVARATALSRLQPAPPAPPTSACQASEAHAERLEVLKNMERWMVANGADLHDLRADLVDVPGDDMGVHFGVVYGGRQTFTGHSLPLRIPRSLSLSWRNYVDRNRDALGIVPSMLSLYGIEQSAAVSTSVAMVLCKLQGDDCFWSPYIKSLPQLILGVPGWTPQETELALEREDLAELWRVHQSEKEHVSTHLMAVCDSRQLPWLQLSEARATKLARWALGVFHSRSFGSDSDSEMIPFLDMMNHRGVWEGGMTVFPHKSGVRSVDDVCEPTSVPSDTELFYSYSSSLQPVPFCLHYDFIPAAFHLPPLAHSTPRIAGVRRWFQRLLQHPMGASDKRRLEVCKDNSGRTPRPLVLLKQLQSGHKE